jgi:uncharacterized membrane protein
LKLSKFTISISQILGGLFIGAVPLLYQKYLQDSEYTTCFYISQIAYIIQGWITVMLALRFNTLLGIPDLLVFLIAGPIA